MKVEAFQIAEEIDLKKFRAEYTTPPLIANSSELLYQHNENQFFYLLSYGVVAFAGVDNLAESALLKFIRTYAKDHVTEDYREDVAVNVKPGSGVIFDYNSITIPELSPNALRLIMLNIAQSVALDYYEALSDEILKNTKKMTRQLEQTGRLRGSQKELMQFIGKTLSIKNSIVDDLYIFDAPDSAWENELLGRIDDAIKRTLDLRMRYRDIDYKLKIVHENLTVFTDILQNRESTRLEWIIIILIMIEVVHLFWK
ncbi:RMD1 family protein [Runella sp. CRIBMP]|uniref:RMD1 family protein n=1 Tax=Runella sp. CRIBMP TaxID=2683261 RepID=UPI001411FBF0|nr:RMD1 family protein [Runella sp. CRIBMP]NBB19403.1 RMD1 family protein [Runella sp. CRIBMP]